MAVTLTGLNGLFTRIGRYGRMANDMRLYQLNIGLIIETLMEQFDVENDRIVVQFIPQADLDARRSAETLLSDTLTDSATAALIAQVAEDSPSAGGSRGAALAELITQMQAASKSVIACTVAVSTSALTNFGNGNIVVSSKRGDGLIQQLLYPEVSPIICTTDAQTGGATEGQEVFTYVGGVPTDSVWSWDYPIGSGVATEFSAIDATQDDSGNNVLTNSNFELFTANLPNQWTLLSGIAGTDFQKSTTQFYDGVASLEFLATGSTCGIGQLFNNGTTGTSGVLLPNTSYPVNVALKADGVVTAGVLPIDLYDTAAAAVVNDTQGVANSFTVTLSTLTTSWAWSSGVFRLPGYVTPTTIIRLRITTGLTGANVYLDHLGMGVLTRTYAGGPGVAVFSGSLPFVEDDGWNMTATNDYGGSSNLSTFQWLFDRLFNMRGQGLLLPYAASVADVQTITSTQVSGTFTLTFVFPNTVSVTTAAIAYDASAATVAAALLAASSILSSSNVTCTGGALPGTGIIVTFSGLLTGFQNLMTATASAATVTVAHTTSGVPSISDGTITT